MSQISNIDNMDSIQKFNGMENGKVGKDVVKEIAIHVGKLKEK